MASSATILTLSPIWLKDVDYSGRRKGTEYQRHKEGKNNETTLICFVPMYLCHFVPEQLQKMCY